MNQSPMSAFTGMKKPNYKNEKCSFSDIAKTIFNIDFSPNDASKELSDPLCSHLAQFVFTNQNLSYYFSFQPIRPDPRFAGDDFFLDFRIAEKVLDRIEWKEILFFDFLRQNEDQLLVVDFRLKAEDVHFQNVTSLTHFLILFENFKNLDGWIERK